MGVTPPMTGKTVLITGGTCGIGRAAAIGLASMGARVGITGRDRTRAERAAAAIARESGNPAVDVFVADMSFPAWNKVMNLDRYDLLARGNGGRPLAAAASR